MSTHPKEWYQFNLYHFLFHVHLSFLQILIPIPFKHLFYKCLGAKFKKGGVVIGGELLDPHLITFEGKCIVGFGAILLGHAGQTDKSDKLYLGEIHLEDNTLIGVKSVIMPGVYIGKNSTVLPMSFVKTNTQIPPNEIWGGNPAQKIKDVKLEK